MIMGLNEWSGFGSVAMFIHARTQNESKQNCVLMSFPPGLWIHFYFPHPGKAGVMPIRRAAASSTAEKAPSAAAEEGEAGVVHHLN